MKEKKIGRQGYYDYLKSPKWKSTKIRYLKSKMPKCCGVCGAEWNNSMVFHHKTYKRLGDEKLMDIVPLCRPCHQAVHDFHEQVLAKLGKKRRNAGLWGCVTAVRRKYQKAEMRQAA